MTKNLFQRIGLIGKYADQNVAKTLQTIVSHLRLRKRALAIDAETAIVPAIDDLPRLDRDQLGRQCDLAIVVGGDGTLLNAARSLVAHQVPILGINLGRLGFLVEMTPDRLPRKLDVILSGEFRVEERFLLQAQIIRNGKLIGEYSALNDVVVHKTDVARMIELETFVDNIFVNSQRSDGLIVATPTGSTAYALAGGGPIVHPCVDAVVLVPICPHTLSNRPIVLDANRTITICVGSGGRDNTQVTCDGQLNFGLVTGDQVVVRKHEKPIKLIQPLTHDYYQVLRAKLGWGGRP